MFVLFTDFGLTGPYVGQMKAQLLKEAPETPIVDLMHDVPAFNIGAGGLLLNALYGSFPAQAIFLCIVDPGVGGPRKPIFIKTDERIFIGPDNGLLKGLVKDTSKAEAFEILWRPERLSASFHGRDLFAPIATKLHHHIPFDHRALPLDQLETAQDFAENSIIYIDHYGNGWTGIASDPLSKHTVLKVNGQEITYAGVFCDTATTGLFWYGNSSGFVEIACNQASAKERLGFEIGTHIEISP